LEPEGAHRGNYDPSLAATIVDEAAGLLKSIGFASHHVILIGGIVPGLLVPVLDPGIEPHIGTTDLDFCLSMALVEGDTAEYERIEQGLKQAGFVAAEQSWRWRGGADKNVIVEFFCPAGPDRPAGRMFRPRASELPVTKRNFGGTLSALALAAGVLISEDIQVIEREADLPGNRGRQMVELRVTGIASFLAAKAEALRNRDKPKDAYDIVWLIEAWQDGPVGAARAVQSSPIFAHPGMARALEILDDQFGDIDRAGARAYARFMDDGDTDPDMLAQRAVGAFAEFLSEVRRERDVGRPLLAPVSGEPF
jgi:Nucleotidyl transferase AbiEii toxin, Type IV TA system